MRMRRAYESAEEEGHDGDADEVWREAGELGGRDGAREHRRALPVHRRALERPLIVPNPRAQQRPRHKARLYRA